MLHIINQTINGVENRFREFENWYGLNKINLDSNVCLLIFNNLRNLSEDVLLRNLNVKIKKGELKKIILYSADMDWVAKQDDVDIIVNNLNDIFKENINKIFLSLTSLSWNRDWKNIATRQGLGCISMVLDRNIQLNKNTNLIQIEREKHFCTMQNEPRPIRIYLYDYLIKNNLLDKFEYSFFITQTKDYLNWEDRVGGDDGLQKLMGEYPKQKSFEEKENIDRTYDLQISTLKPELNSYFSIMMETNYMNGGIYYGFSEKSFKAYCLKKPMMLWASPAAPKGLTELGFKMYDKIFDIELMSDSSHDIRRIRFFDDIKRICSLPISQIKNMYIDNLDVIEYNYSNMIKLIEKEKMDLIELIIK